MTPPPIVPSDPTKTPAPALSTAQAKQNLVAWSAETDQALAATVSNALQNARTQVSRAAPWAVGGAALVGVLSLLRSHRAEKAPRAGGGSASGGLLKSMATLVPIVLSLIPKRR